MKFSDELTKLLLMGGTIIKNRISKGKYEMIQTVLVRMPKGKWIPDSRGEDYSPFEFVYAQNYSKEDVLDISGWRKGDVRSVKKMIAKEHSKNAAFMLMREMKKENK